ncbi:MAG: hypothetical protein UR18_C0006G0005 [Candidatus Nomurabacteria bacterium GW2011_GWE2_31_40]|nr:MAG: hypothetical protein UR18_C0006G0005 [Candidatus Nomurabacteria bacterium GW2011_GWE2_31_40]OGV06218.1 MAG: hypothetical protein A2299_12335 [Stygiobacter sp. RIFOXYB2_FULL_37_11]OGV15968.1 MAG: hypothetical protein A2440_03265 [Stygiobacter sp. RIFOXYC2_FULL_38_25]OGV27912.1 MAG: hypothetical protein A2499_17370 [Stygiobacter sp. RIFOXYC12_FULL_38_8]OGV80445.1 MAG: hypothetical protein A2X65_04425 [Stygiobacter sp. GWF2_38_21]
MTVTGQKKISIYDPATGTVVQLNNISEEGEFEKKGAFIKTSAGSRMYSGDESKAEFLSLDWTGYDQLVTWMKERTPVRFVTYGLDEHILWYEDTLITVDLKTVFSPYKRSGFKIYFEKAGGVHEIYKGANLLYKAKGWKDVDTSNKADNYIINTSGGSFTFLFQNGMQKISCVTDGNLTFAATLVYPISGITLNLFQRFGVDNNIIQDQYTYIKDFGGSPLTNVHGPRSNVLSATSPANVYTFELYLINANYSMVSGNIIQIYSPYLGLASTILEILY